MTPEQIEMHRKRFEDLMREKVHPMQKIEAFNRYDSGLYRNGFIDGAWQGYLLCAENMEVELPKRPNRSDFISSYEEGFDYGAESMIDDCIAMLESQGIKVKP